MYERRGTPYHRKTKRNKHRKTHRLLAVFGTLVAALAVFSMVKVFGSPVPTAQPIAPSGGVALVTSSPDAKSTPPASATATPSISPKATAKPTEKPADKQTAKQTNKATKAPQHTASSGTGQEDFSNAVFIGDSRTVGLQLNGGITGAQFFCSTGLNVESARTKPVVTLPNGKKGTVIEALKQTSCKRIYVMFGVNELGWPSASGFAKKYGQLIQEIRNVQPNAKIYVQSILPISKAKSDSSNIYNQSKVNDFNKALKQMAGEQKVTYLNVSDAVIGSDGYLPKDAASDGIHLTKSYCKKWVSYLKSHS